MSYHAVGRTPGRGRPRKGHHWVPFVGWVPDSQQTALPTAAYPASFHHAPARAVPAPPKVRIAPNPGLLDAADAAQLRREEAIRQERERRIAEEKDKEEREAREAETARIAQEEALKKQREQERLDAPRRYAASLWGTEGAPVYYFDIDGNFQQLGKERPRRPLSPPKRPKKRVRRVVDRWVCGPSEKYQLEAGESELVTMTVWVWVDC